MYRRPSFQSIIQGLETLPPEIAHQIFDGLRVWDILRLLSLNNPRITAVITSHQILGKLFNHDPAKLAEAGNFACLHREIALALGLPQVPEYSVLSQSARDVKPAQYGPIIKYFHVCMERYLGKDGWIYDLLHRYGIILLDLRYHKLGRTSSDFNMLSGNWNFLREAQNRLNTLKSDQLLRAADLLDNNPDILKRMTDPSQTLRPNIAHITGRMRLIARKIQRAILGNDSAKNPEYFRYRFFMLVPFDRALRYVLNGLCAYAYSMSREKLKGGGDAVAYRLWAWVERLRREGFSSSLVRRGGGRVLAVGIRPAVVILVRGLLAVYEFQPYSASVIRDGLCRGDIARISSSPNYEDDVVLARPRGYKDAKHHLRSPSWRNHEPHDERELEWLEAFVAVYRYLQENGIGERE